jgi:hypothetical protein
VIKKIGRVIMTLPPMRGERYLYLILKLFLRFLNPASPFNPEHKDVHRDRVGDRSRQRVNGHSQIGQSPPIGSCTLYDSGIAELDKGVPDLVDCL